MRGTRHGNWLQFVPMHNEITNINLLPHTPEEIEAEQRYRIEERLGIMCGAEVPTDEQLEIAVREADEWMRNYLTQCPSTPTCTPASPDLSSPQTECGPSEN
jgi:hypothetical protein